MSDARWLGRASYITTHLMVLVVTGVLLGGFFVQFAMGEFPCPLCILERMGMILATIGPVWLIAQSYRSGRVEGGDYALAFGMTVVASVLGAAVAARQVLLHIVPGDPGYGSPVLGLHLYTWALLVFLALLFSAGVHLLFAKEALPVVPRTPPLLSKGVLGLFLLVILANAIAVFAEAGFHLFLPSGPTEYRLFGS